MTVKCSHCEVTLVAECVSSHEEKCLEKPIRCPTCSTVVTLRKWSDHECEAARDKGIALSLLFHAHYFYFLLAIFHFKMNNVFRNNKLFHGEKKETISFFIYIVKEYDCH